MLLYCEFLVQSTEHSTPEVMSECFINAHWITKQRGNILLRKLAVQSGSHYKPQILSLTYKIKRISEENNGILQLKTT